MLLATNPNPLAFTSGVPTNNKNELDGLNLVLIFQHHNNLAPLNTIQHDCLTAQTSGIPRTTTAAREEGQDRGCFGKTVCLCVHICISGQDKKNWNWAGCCRVGSGVLAELYSINPLGIFPVIHEYLGRTIASTIWPPFTLFPPLFEI